MRKLLILLAFLLLIPLASATSLNLTGAETYTLYVNETYDTVNITNGATLYFANNYTPVLTVANWMYVRNATINANSLGAGGGAAAGANCAAGGTGVYGGNWRCGPGLGGDGTGAGGSAAPNGVNGTNKAVSAGGGGGGGGRGCNVAAGAGGSGGGIISIVGLIGSTITINGTVTSNGGNGGNGGAYGGCGDLNCGAGGGGAAGGTVLIDSYGIVNLTGSIISVQGGNGGSPINGGYTCAAGSAGSPGQTKVFYFILYNSSVSAQGDTSIYWEQQAPDWVVTLNTPADNAMQKVAASLFNCSAQKYSGFNISNVTLLIDGLQNYTSAASGTSASISTSQNIASGVHVWNCEMRNTNNTRFTGTYNSTLTIDLTPPALNVTIAPSYVSRRQGAINNISFNWTASDTYFLSTWLSYNGVNYTGIGTAPNFGYNLSIITGGTNYVFIYASDTAGNINVSTKTVYLNIYNYSVSYQPYIVQNKATSISIYLSATDFTQYNATLVYNGTAHAMAEYYNPLYKLLTYSFTSASVNVTTTYPFYINFSLDNEIIRTENFNQTVQAIPSLTIAQSCSTAFFRFALFDEGNLSSLNGTFEYNFKHGLENTDKKETYGSISNSHQIEICTNFSLSDHWIISQGEIIYYATGYEPRRYYIYNGTYVSATVQNISLYDIQTADSTSFQLEVEDTSMEPYNNVYASLIRWYPNLNAYKVVEMGKTDEYGKTVFHVKTEDVDYIIGIYEPDGTVIKLPTETVRMICLTSPCTYTMRIIPPDADYISFLNVVYTFTFDEDTNIWAFTFSESSGRTSTMNMTIWKDTGTNTYPVCSNLVTGSAGTMTCNTSGWTGLLRGEVYRAASPSVPLVQKIENILQTPFKSPWVLWLSFIVGLPIAVLLAWISPLAGLIGGVLMLLPALYFGAIPPAVIGAVALMAALVAHFIKRVS